MAPLFSSLTMNNNNNEGTSPKRRRNLLGRPSFFSRPSATTASTTSTLSATSTLIPLEPTTHLPKLGGPIITDPLQPDPISTDTSEELKISLLPSALSNTSLGPTSKSLPHSQGPTPSNSLGGISASTSRNTVLPASHPILTSSGSTFLPPSLSLGFDLQDHNLNKALPTLASAIKLPSPALKSDIEKTGADSIITRKPVPPLPISGSQGSDIASQARIHAPSFTIPLADPAPIKPLPRSTSGSSIFGSTRLARITSRSSILKSGNGIEPSGTGNGVGGMSLGRRISRRLSIDQLRPIFSGNNGSSRRKIVLPDSGVGTGGGEKMDIQRWAQGAVTGPEAGEAPPLTDISTTTAPIEGPSQATKAKERMVLPGLRTWRNKFSSSSKVAGSVSSRPKNPNSVYPIGGSVTESVRSLQVRDESWVDVGSVRSMYSAQQQQSLLGSVRQGSTRSTMGALRRMEVAANGHGDSPAGISVVEASEANLVPPTPEIVEMKPLPTPSDPIPSVPRAQVSDSPLDPSARRSAALLDSLLARPSDEAIVNTATFPIPHPHINPSSSPTLSPAVAPGMSSSISATSISLHAPLMSPAVAESLLEPMRSPLGDETLENATGFPGFGTSVSIDDISRELSEAQEIIRDVRESSGQFEDGDENDEDAYGGMMKISRSTSLSSVARATLPHPESGMSFHTAQSASSTDINSSNTTAIPRSRSKSVLDLSTSTSSLIERTEREQGEGWWSAPRTRPISTTTSTNPTRSSFVEKARASFESSSASPNSRRHSELAINDRRRRSTPSSVVGAIKLHSGRPAVASVVAKLESQNTCITNSPRKSILRPSKLQFADAEEDLIIDVNDDNDMENTPTRLPNTTRRTFNKEITYIPPPSPSSRISRSGTPVSRRRESTTDSFSHLFYAPPGTGGGSGTASPARSTIAQRQLAEELARTKERHALELDALLSALTAAKAENEDLRVRIGTKKEVLFGPEIRNSTLDLGIASSSSPSRRQRKGLSRTIDASRDADEFGRFDNRSVDSQRGLRC